MKIIISIIAVMFYAVIGCFVSKKVYSECDPLCILLWPIMAVIYIPIHIICMTSKGFGWFYEKLCKHKGTHTHIDQNIKNRWDDSGSPYDQLLKAKQAIEKNQNIEYRWGSSDSPYGQLLKVKPAIEKIKNIDNIENKIVKPFHELLAGTEDDLKVAEYMLDKERRALLITMMNTVGRLSPDVECLAEEWAAKKKALDERKVALNREKGADKDE